MMIEDILNLGDKIEMCEIKRTKRTPDLEKESVRTYVSQILEFDEDDDNIISIAMPIYEGKLIPLEVGRRFDVYFYGKKCIYQAEATITNRYKSQNVYVLVIELDTSLKKFQRRQFFRLETNVQLQYKLFTEEDEKYFRLMGKIPDDMENRPFMGGVSLDISGGGIRFVSRDQFNRGDIVFVHLEALDGTDKFECEPIAEVLNSVPARGRDGVFETRIEFTRIDEREREALIKFIFREERRIRNKTM